VVVDHIWIEIARALGRAASRLKPVVLSHIRRHKQGSFSCNGPRVPQQLAEKAPGPKIAMAFRPSRKCGAALESVHGGRDETFGANPAPVPGQLALIAHLI